jgi:hypothetical protein
VALCLAGAMAGAVPRVEAAELSVGAPVRVAAGWIRIAGRYGSAGVEPVFRAVARCRGGGAVHVLDPLVHLAPAEGMLWLDLPGNPDGLVPAPTPCEAPELVIEMLVDATVVASAPVPRGEVVTSGLPAALLTPPSAPAPGRLARRLSLKGEKAPFSKRTEAGVVWSLDSRVSIQLNYERTPQPPLMPFDHDDGILTRLRVGF